VQKPNGKNTGSIQPPWWVRPSQRREDEYSDVDVLDTSYYLGKGMPPSLFYQAASGSGEVPWCRCGPETIMEGSMCGGYCLLVEDWGGRQRASLGGGRQPIHRGLGRRWACGHDLGQHNNKEGEEIVPIHLTQKVHGRVKTRLACGFYLLEIVSTRV
jgi:hypothetical protein